jgi:hypothetical protein
VTVAVLGGCDHFLFDRERSAGEVEGDVEDECRQGGERAEVEGRIDAARGVSRLNGRARVIMVALCAGRSIWRSSRAGEAGDTRFSFEEWPVQTKRYTRPVSTHESNECVRACVRA